jgi:thioredoxin-related protein
MKKQFALLGISLVFTSFLVSFSPKNKHFEGKIQWLTIEEAYARTQKEPRKTIIDVYTDWCGWCKVMDRETFTNKEVIDYINKHYYPVKFNAESQADVKVGTTIYKFDKNYNANQAAVALMGGKMSYPTTVYLDEKFNLIQPIPGYQDAKTFHQVITYLGDNYHTKEDFEKYKAGTYREVFKAQIAKL